MNKQDFLNMVENLSSDKSISSYEKILNMLDEDGLEEKYSFTKDELENLRRNATIGLLKSKLEELDSKNYKEAINLRGKLISIYKLAQKEAKTKQEKLMFQHEELEELKKHKVVLKKYRKSGDTKLSIPSKVALTVKEIAKSIEIFMKEKDVLKKTTNVLKETTAGSAHVALLVGGLGLAIQALTGVPFSLSTIVSAAPSIAYIGLSSIIRNLSSKTEFQQYEYQQSDEYKAIVKDFGETHKEQYMEIARMTKEREGITNLDQRISLNEALIEKIDDLADSTNIDGIRDALLLQSLECFRDIKECRQQIKDDYLDEKNDDVEKYKENNKELMHVNFEIFKRENSFKEAFKFATKNTLNNMKVILIAKVILSAINPTTFPLLDVEKTVIPLAFAIVNGVIDIPTFKNKLKYRETKYQDKIKTDNLDRIDEILMMSNQPVYA